MSHPTTTIDFLRHGEPQGGQKYRGSLDDPLSPLGWEQMQTTIDNHPAPWQRVITSPLQRCCQFAEKVGKDRSIPVMVEQDFREMSFGLWEGKTKQELFADSHSRELIENFWRNPKDNTPPEGEPIQLVHDRISTAWQTMIDNFAGEHILLVAHSGVIRVTVAMVLGIPLENLSRMLVPYAALSRITIDHIGDTPIPRLIFWHVGGLEP
jgi:alpha-ribazole phosphatase